MLPHVWRRQDTPERQRPFTLDRTARMGSWGLCFYGPYQNWWYGLLDRTFGAKTTVNFLWKVSLHPILSKPAMHWRTAGLGATAGECQHPGWSPY